MTCRTYLTLPPARQQEVVVAIGKYHGAVLAFSNDNEYLLIASFCTNPDALVSENLFLQ